MRCMVCPKWASTVDDNFFVTTFDNNTKEKQPFDAMLSGSGRETEVETQPLWRKRAVLVRAVDDGVDVKRRRCLEALLVPQPVCDGAEVALHDTGQELVPVMLRHGTPTVVDDSDQAEQQGGQGAAAAQQLQPPVAREELALQGAAPKRAAGQHGAEQHRVTGVQQSVHGQAAAADNEKSGCGVQR